MTDRLPVSAADALSSLELWILCCGGKWGFRIYLRILTLDVGVVARAARGVSLNQPLSSQGDGSSLARGCWLCLYNPDSVATHLRLCKYPSFLNSISDTMTSSTIHNLHKSICSANYGIMRRLITFADFLLNKLTEYEFRGPKAMDLRLLPSITRIRNYTVHLEQFQAMTSTKRGQTHLYTWSANTRVAASRSTRCL